MLKSIFIVAYMTLAIAVTFNSVRGLLAGDAWLPLVATLMATAPVSLLLVRLLVMKDLARTAGKLPVLTALAGLGSAIALFSWAVQSAPFSSVLGTFVMTALYLFYVFWYSKLDRSASKLVTGAALPAFELFDTYGTFVSSDSFKGGVAILIFYRGNWCPLCVAQVKEMAANYNKLKDLGARVVFISPQPQGHTISLSKKFGSDGLEFMRDSGNSAAKILGIFSKFGTPMGMQALGYESDTVLPTVIITDAKGNVVWTDETDNYRVRPEPETYLAKLDEMGLGAP